MADVRVAIAGQCRDMTQITPDKSACVLEQTNTDSLTVQHQKPKRGITGEFGDPYGVAPQHKFSIPGRVCPTSKPYHFGWWA